MRTTDTKKRLLEAALDLFSERGFDAVNMQSLADAVGIKQPSIYKHFKNKQEILDTLLDQAEAKFKEKSLIDGLFENFNVDSLNEDGLVELSQAHISFVLHDPLIKRMRKLLTIEQFRNQRMKELHILHDFINTITFAKKVIEILVASGKFKVLGNQEYMAYLFIAPVSLQLYRCDCEPEYEPTAMAFIEEHMRYMWRLCKA